MGIMVIGQGAVSQLFGSAIEMVDLRSIWLILAFVMFFLSVLVGTLARATGNLSLLTPQLLYEGWLHYSPWEFKKNAVYWAGEHFKANSGLVNRKGLALSLMTLLLIAEVALLLVWVATEGSE